MANFRIAQGNRLPVLVVRLRGPNKQALDLTGCTVTVAMTHDGCGKVIGSAGVIAFVDARGGVVSYAWAAHDTDIPGVYQAAFTVTDPNGLPMDCPNDDFLEIYIRPKPGHGVRGS